MTSARTTILRLAAALALALAAAATGACGNTPVVGMTCTGSQRACGNTCVDVAADSANCGACGTRCGANAECRSGACQPTCGVAGLACCANNACDEMSRCEGGACASTARDTAPHAAAALVNGGTVMASPGYRLISTLGQSSIHQGSMRSDGFRLRGGVVGASGGQR